MNLMSCARALAVAFMSCALGACVAAEPGEGESDDAALTTADEGLQVSPESVAPPQGGESNAVACSGDGNWCLAMCSKTGDHLNVVGRVNQLVTGCAASGEQFCTSKNLGYRTLSCWGHL